MINVRLSVRIMPTVSWCDRYESRIRVRDLWQIVTVRVRAFMKIVLLVEVVVVVVVDVVVVVIQIRPDEPVNI